MKIAVPYSDGQVFQHFGKSEQFKIYDTIDDEIISSEIVDTSGSGHSALADFLKEKGAGVLICGGIGVGAVTALQNAGIQILGGAEGEADKCVEGVPWRKTPLRRFRLCILFLLLRPSPRRRG